MVFPVFRALQLFQAMWYCLPDSYQAWISFVLMFPLLLDFLKFIAKDL